MAAAARPNEADHNTTMTSFCVDEVLSDEDFSSSDDDEGQVRYYLAPLVHGILQPLLLSRRAWMSNDASSQPSSHVAGCV